MTIDIHAEKILVLDFGSQYTQLIARRVREVGVYCEIIPYDCPETTISKMNPQGIILSGGPESVTANNSPQVPHSVFELGVPILGICYGMQAMVQQLGGTVISSEWREFGYAEVQLQECCLLFGEGAEQASSNSLLEVWMSHGDSVAELPPGFEGVASTENAPHAVIVDRRRHWYGVQFHPEVTHTKDGTRFIKQFVREICRCHGHWTLSNIIESQLAHIRAQVGQQNVLLALSGGVDSSVVAALLHRAIGEQLTCVFVDTGLLRLNEGDEVLEKIGNNMGVKIVRVNAQERFYRALQGVHCPEAKRKTVGELFIKIFEEQAAQCVNATWLAQGTIYSDVIESAGNQVSKGHVIKSHHNVGGLPATMALKLIEPLRELFKDEVRAMGVELGLPHELLYCHPFPGPGLAVRVLGEVREEYVSLLRQADAIFIAELRKQGWYHRTSQAFAVFLPVKSVAVMGDARVYDYVIALRAIESQDFMTATWAQLPYDFLSLVSNRIINEIPGISRVTYDISGKPPATIEWE